MEVKVTIEVEVELEPKGVEAYEQRIKAKMEVVHAAASCLVKGLTGVPDTMANRMLALRQKGVLAAVKQGVGLEKPPTGADSFAPAMRQVDEMAKTEKKKKTEDTD